MLQLGPWIPALLLAIGAGYLDWCYRRLPNWLVLSGVAAGFAVNTILYHWPGLKAAAFGTLLGLGLLLPFVLIRRVTSKISYTSGLSRHSSSTRA